MGIAVAAVVFLLEISEQMPGEGKVQFVSLAAVAEVDAALVVNSSRPSFVVKIFRSSFLEGREFAIQSRDWEFARESPQHSAGVVFDDVAHQNADSGKRAGKRGHDHAWDAEGFGQGAGVEASGAPEGYQGEVAGIAAALDRDYADGFLHGGVHDADYAGGETFESERTSLLLQPFSSDAAGAIEIESEVAAEEA